MLAFTMFCNNVANDIDKSVLLIKIMVFVLFFFLFYLIVELENAKEEYEKVKQELENTMNELSDMWEMKTALESSLAILLALYKSRYCNRLNDSVIFIRETFSW